MDYWEIPKLPPETTVCIIGGGPSLTAEDVTSVCGTGWRIIGINDAYLLVDRAGGSMWVHYFCDRKWYLWHHERPEYARRQTDFTVSLENVGFHMGDVKRLQNLGREGWHSAIRHGVCTGRNSGFQAIYLAMMAGAARIVLLGFDMDRTPGRSHWFGNHPAGNPDGDALGRFASEISKLAKTARQIGCEIINASPHTKLTCFERVTLKEEINKC